MDSQKVGRPSDWGPGSLLIEGSHREMKLCAALIIPATIYPPTGGVSFPHIHQPVEETNDNFQGLQNPLHNIQVRLRRGTFDLAVFLMIM